MAKQLDLSELSQAERDARLAASVSQYGIGTKSYNASAEKKELERQRTMVTEKYNQAPRTEFIIGPICRCRSFALAHDLSRHRELRSDYDWRLESERHGATYYPEGVK